MGINIFAFVIVLGVLIFFHELGHFLNMQEAKPRPAGSTWVSFNPKSLPNGAELTHQLTRGFVKVFFNGQAESYELLKEKYEGKVPKDATIEIAGKSVAISLEVQKLNPLKTPFEDEQEKVRQALHGLSKLEKAVSLNNASNE